MDCRAFDMFGPKDVPAFCCHKGSFFLLQTETDDYNHFCNLLCSLKYLGTEKKESFLPSQDHFEKNSPDHRCFFLLIVGKEGSD